MRADEIREGATYQGEAEQDKRIATRLWDSHDGRKQVEYYSLSERMEWNTALVTFARWAQSEVPAETKGEA